MVSIRVKNTNLLRHRGRAWRAWQGMAGQETTARDDRGPPIHSFIHSFRTAPRGEIGRTSSVLRMISPSPCWPARLLSMQYYSVLVPPRCVFCSVDQQFTEDIEVHTYFAYRPFDVVHPLWFALSSPAAHQRATKDWLAGWLCRPTSVSTEAHSHTVAVAVAVCRICMAE